MVERSYFGSGLWISADLKDVTQRWFAPRPIPRSNRLEHCSVGWASQLALAPDACWRLLVNLEPGHKSLALCRCPPLFERPLGKPMADAVKGADGVYRRAFASGTKVTFDTKTNNGTIVWGNGAVAH